MKSKILLITGADGALGKTVTARLLDEGWVLHAAVLNEKSKSILDEFFPQQINKTLFPFIADLAKETEVQNWIRGIKGNIFGLVHLAGGYKGAGSIADYTEADYNFLMDLNVKPTFLLLKEIVPILKASGMGSIVTIGAKPVLHQAKGNTLYTASKGALVAITLSVAEECRNFNVRANIILPATLQTPNNLSWATEEQYKTFTPTEDVADTIAFLMSEKAKGITGVSIPMYNKIEW